MNDKFLSMKRGCFYFIVLSIAFAGCRRGNDPLLTEIPEYLSSIQPIIADLEVVSKHFVKIYLDKDDISNVMQKIDSLIIPRVKDIREKALNISPKTMEIAEIHSLLVDSLSLRISAYSEMKRSLEEKNSQLFDSGLQKLNQSKLKEDEFFSKGKQLFQAYGYNLAYFPETMVQEEVGMSE